MKSLEIVNERIEAIKRDEEGYYCAMDIPTLETIKKDLEVLEIFKALIFHNIHSIGFNSSIKSYEALFNIGEITQEQLDRLKQWLEENENE